MKIPNKKYIRNIAAATALLLASAYPATAQEVIQIDPLFEYVQAPEEIEGIMEKSNYLMEHFWDPMDFKNATTLDQNALNHAFSVYVTPMRFAEKSKSLESVDKLIEKISKNPTLLFQFTKAAEENLYGPRAEIWIDEVFLKFLQASLKNKKITGTRRDNYRRKAEILTRTTIGNPAEKFDFEDTEGGVQSYFPMSTPTLIIFGDPTLADWRMSRMRMETNTALTRAADLGKINIIYIVSKDVPDWKNDVANYPKSWKIGYAPKIAEFYDIRTMPSAYVIGADAKLKLKNADIATAVNSVLSEVKQ